MSILGFRSTKYTEKRELSLPILRKILETMREGVIVVGANTRVLTCNSAAQIAFSRSGETLENSRLSEIFRDLALHQAFGRALNERTASDLKIEIPETERRKFDVHIAPVEIDNARSAAGVFYEITKIEHLEKVRQEFLSNISHELRTPLTSILAFVETLEDGALDDEQNNRRFLSVIRKNAERMHHLINDILELSSIESGNVKIEIRKVSLAPHIDEAFTNLSGKAEERQIELANHVPADVHVFADVMRLEQMLANLIDNAVKFNRRGGRVTVGHIRDGIKDTISVTDTGEGIGSEHLQRIFERFYRTDRARSREIGGTGLGLAIVKHLARLHGGEVSVRSTIGHGTTFSIELPGCP